MWARNINILSFDNSNDEWFESYETAGKDLPNNVKAPVLKHSHDGQETLKKCPDKYECMNLPKDIIDLLKQDDSLIKAWFRFDKASWKLIFPEGFSNTEKMRKIRKFLEFSGWLYSDKADKLKKSNPEQYKIEKFDKYIELTKLSTQIEGMNKKLLQYRYINSIYQDIIDEGFIFQKDVNWNYKIYNPKTKEVAKWAYAKMLLDSKNLNSFDFDFAFLSSITNNSAIYNEKWIISQSHTISAIFDKHKITDKSWRRITPTSIMLIDWTNINSQIDEKIKHVESTNLHSYQELMYLKWFVENKDYLSKNTNRTLYRELNAYNTAEWQVNALMWAAKWETTEKGMMEKIMWVANELAIPWIMLWILLSIFSGTRGVWKALLIGWIGWLVWAKVMKAVWSRMEGLSDDDLWLIVPQEIIYSVESKDKDYSKWIKKFQELNKANNGKSWYKENWEKLPAIDDNKTIINISNDILKMNKDEDVIVAPSVLFAALKVINPSFSYSLDDVKVYLKLLNSEWFAHDPSDKTIRDYLSEGVDIANKPYESITAFEWVMTWWELSPFDTEMNGILKPLYDSTKLDRKKRKEFKKVLETINSQFGALKIIDSFSSKKAAIISALETYDPTYKTKLDDVFKKYELYQESRNELDKYTGLIDWNSNDVNLALKKLIGTWSYTEIYSKVEKGIKELNKILIIDPILKIKEPFKALNNDIQDTIDELKISKKDIIRAAKEEWVTFPKKAIDKARFNTNPEELFDEMNEVFQKIKSWKDDIKSGSNIEVVLENILDDYKWLDKWIKNLSIWSLTIWTGMIGIFQTKIQDEIILNFIPLKNELKVAINKKLLPIYEANKDNFDIVNILTTDINSVNIANLVKVQEYINSKKSEVEKAEKEYSTAKKMFPTLKIKKWSTDYSSYKIGALESQFDTKKASLETEVKGYINTFIPESDIIKIKEQSEILKAIKNNFGLLIFNNWVTIDKREWELVKNMLLKNVKDFKTELRGISWLSNEKKEVIDNFLIWNIKYWTLDISNMKVKNLLDMIKTGKLKYGSESIKIEDIKDIFVSWAIFNALNNI